MSYFSCIMDNDCVSLALQLSMFHGELKLIVYNLFEDKTCGCSVGPFRFFLTDESTTWGSSWIVLSIHIDNYGTSLIIATNNLPLFILLVWSLNIISYCNKYAFFVFICWLSPSPMTMFLSPSIISFFFLSICFVRSVFSASSLPSS